VTRAYHVLDVFTDQPFGGNPLAVVTDAEGLPTEVMQAVAGEFNLSETVFLLPPVSAVGTRRLRIFTPRRELSFAGHPTVGAAFLLAATGAVALRGDETRIVLEEGVGPVPVTIRSRQGRPLDAELTAARRPQLGPPPPGRAELAALLSLDPADLDAEPSPAFVSCGTPHLLVPLASVDAVRRARLDLAVWERLLGSAWATAVYIVAPAGQAPDGRPRLRARMFAPDMGIPEDPATGAAAAALAGYLALRDPAVDGTLRWELAQGIEMGRPSRLLAAADKADGAVVAVRVRGTAVLVADGVLHLPGR
jgi:trans-2,3-dihydro-3-hydroxyanthranilate isomerase